MTSSSSTSGSGSLSSQSVPSSMDSAATIPTQDIPDGDFFESEEIEEIGWGKLIPVGRCFNGAFNTLIDLKKEVYQFGRDTDCDVCFPPSAFRKNSQYQSLSKKHFELIKETSGNGDYTVCIRDLSSNGTFVNGTCIGKGNKQVIENNAEISFVSPTNAAYVFLDLEATKREQESFPQEVKEKFTISKVLGRGVFGEVRLAFRKGNECKKVAIKIINKNLFEQRSDVHENRRSILEEVEILKKLDHPCIVKVFDAVETPEKLYIVLEFVEGGELFHRVVDAKHLSEPVTKLYFYQMLVCVKYLHDNGFTHRDLKPENILLNSTNSDTRIKITDFGLSKFVGEQSLMKTLCGTPSYLAPEVLRMREAVCRYGKKCDCWSLGVILYVCLAGMAPFADRPDRTLEQQAMAGSYSFSQPIWRGVSDEAKDLIKRLLTVDPNDRISLTDALSHPWMQDENVIEKAKKLMASACEKKPMEAPTETVAKRKNSSNENDSFTSTKRRKPNEDTTLL